MVLLTVCSNIWSLFYCYLLLIQQTNTTQKLNRSRKICKKKSTFFEWSVSTKKKSLGDNVVQFCCFVIVTTCKYLTLKTTVSRFKEKYWFLYQNYIFINFIIIIDHHFAVNYILIVVHLYEVHLNLITILKIYLDLSITIYSFWMIQAWAFIF